MLREWDSFEYEQNNKFHLEFTLMLLVSRCDCLFCDVVKWFVSREKLTNLFKYLHSTYMYESNKMWMTINIKIVINMICINIFFFICAQTGIYVMSFIHLNKLLTHIEGTNKIHFFSKCTIHIETKTTIDKPIWIVHLYLHLKL